MPQISVKKCTSFNFRTFSGLKKQKQVKQQQTKKPQTNKQKTGIFLNNAPQINFQVESIHRRHLPKKKLGEKEAKSIKKPLNRSITLQAKAV